MTINFDVTTSLRGFHARVLCFGSKPREKFLVLDSLPILLWAPSLSLENMRESHNPRARSFSVCGDRTPYALNKIKKNEIMAPVCLRTYGKFKSGLWTCTERATSVINAGSSPISPTGSNSSCCPKNHDL